EVLEESAPSETALTFFEDNIRPKINLATGSLARKINVSIANLARVGKLNKSKEGRDVLDAELNEGSLLKELEFTVKEISGAINLVQSVTKAPMTVIDPASGKPVNLGDGYFAPGSA